jgi:hypothetical protein
LYQVSVSSRLPAWGRSALDGSTYLVTFNVLALATSSLGLLAFLPAPPPAGVLLQRPYLPGQGWLSGFELSPAFSMRSTVAHYGRAQLAHGMRQVLESPEEKLAIPVADGGPRAQIGEVLVCHPPRSRWRWLRRGAVHAIDIALAAALP